MYFYRESVEFNGSSVRARSVTRPVVSMASENVAPPSPAADAGDFAFSSRSIRGRLLCNLDLYVRPPVAQARARVPARGKRAGAEPPGGRTTYVFLNRCNVIVERLEICRTLDAVLSMICWLTCFYIFRFFLFFVFYVLYLVRFLTEGEGRRVFEKPPKNGERDTPLAFVRASEENERAYGRREFLAPRVESKSNATFTFFFTICIYII